MPRRELVGPIGAALQGLGLAASLVVNGSSETGAGIDEATVCGPTLVQGSGRLSKVHMLLDARDLGLPFAPLSALAGGGPEETAATLRELFAGRLPGPLEATVALNAGLALWCCGEAAHPRFGIARALDSIRGGAALATLERLRSLAA